MDTDSKMQPSVYNSSSPRHLHSSPSAKRPRYKLPRPNTATCGDSTSSDIDRNTVLTRKMANDNIDISNSVRSSTSEVDKIRRNSLYMTFNAPKVDEYVSPISLGPSQDIPPSVEFHSQRFPTSSNEANCNPSTVLSS